MSNASRKIKRQEKEDQRLDAEEVRVVFNDLVGDVRTQLKYAALKLNDVEDDTVGPDGELVVEKFQGYTNTLSTFLDGVKESKDEFDKVFNGVEKFSANNKELFDPYVETIRNVSALGEELASHTSYAMSHIFNTMKMEKEEEELITSIREEIDEELAKNKEQDLEGVVDGE